MSLPIENVKRAVEKYQSRNNWGADELASFRKDISTGMFLSASFLAKFKTNYSAADINRKKCLAQSASDIKVKWITEGKKFTAKDLENAALLDCAEAYDTLNKAEAEFEKAKVILRYASEVCHSIKTEIDLIT